MTLRTMALIASATVVTTAAGYVTYATHATQAEISAAFAGGL